MMTMALWIATMGAGETDLYWKSAWQVNESGIEIRADGMYSVWIWAPGNGSAAIAIDGDAVTVDQPAKKEDKYQWLRAGRLELKAGPHKVELGDKVAMLAVAAPESFNPAAVMGDAYAFSRPDYARDARATRVIHTDTVFTMPQFSSREEWETVAARIRKRFLLGSGLVPMPERTPLNAVISGRIERPDSVHGGYSVEKVRFEARPGLLVTGNLYRPLGKRGPFPGVVNPHGHWEEGRFANAAMGCVPARCITFARMGMVAFSYDMTGYNDSKQLEHRWGGEKEKLWGVHPFAVQLWASVRAVDFLQSLPDVSPDRIACTGASGGGTQTFALFAIDPRIQVAAPVNMISHSMQGGCLCENAPLIRLENSNMEVGALMAPKPLLMVSATGDWTRETPRVEFPAIRSIYQLYGARDNIENVHIDAGHNYNTPSREAVYRFFGKHVLGDPQKYAAFKEPPFQLEDKKDLRVFPDDKLPGELPGKDAVIAAIIASNRDKWQRLLPKTAAEFAAFRQEYGDVLPLLLGVSVPAANDLEPERVGFEERRDEGYVVERWIIRRKAAGDAVPALLYRAYDSTPQDAVLLVHGRGKAALADFVNGGPGPLIKALIGHGKAVLTIDAFLLGEHSSPFAQTKRATGPFMDTFMPTDTGYRVQDVLTAIAYLRARRDLTGAIHLAGLDRAGMWCLLAAATDGNVGRLAVDGAAFDPDNDDAWVEQYYVPCIRSVGDVRTAAAMVAPKPMLLFNAAANFSAGVTSIYQAAGAADQLSAQDADIGADKLAAWMVK